MVRPRNATVIKCAKITAHFIISCVAKVRQFVVEAAWPELCIRDLARYSQRNLRPHQRPSMIPSLPIYLAVGSAILITAPLSVLVSRPVTVIQWRYLGAAFAIFCVSCFFLILPFAFPLLTIGHTNWTGKAFSILATYTIILSRERNDPARTFVTFTQKEGAGRRSAVIILLLLLFAGLNSVLGVGNGRPPINWETLLFEATLPGIDEEAVYRAAFLGYILAAVGRKEAQHWWSTAGSVFTCAVLFGLVHALHFDPTLHMHFDATAFAFTGMVGAGLAILTLNSGSILLPVIAHNLTNCLGILL
jgi:membrane protease YdiL (CAAX protease family)